MDYNLTNTQTPTILVVEDDESTGEVLTLVIEQETSYHSLLVRNGQDALQVLQQRELDLLILDYRLPDMTGIEVYDCMQTMDKNKDIPTIFMSATNHQEEIEPRKMVLLEKPFELEALLLTINTLIAQERSFIPPRARRPLS